jgi:hypothetical protein
MRYVAEHWHSLPKLGFGEVLGFVLLFICDTPRDQISGEILECLTGKFLEMMADEGGLVPWMIAQIVCWEIQCGIVGRENWDRVYEVAVKMAGRSVTQKLGGLDVVMSIAMTSNEFNVPAFLEWVAVWREVVEAGAGSVGAVGVFQERGTGFRRRNGGRRGVSGEVRRPGG